MSEDTAAAPAIPLETLIPRIVQHCLSARSARLLERDVEFRGLRFRCHQIYYFHNFATTELQIPISIRALMHAFDCVRDRVTQALLHGLEPPETRGRHPALDDDVERAVLLWITENAMKSSALTARDVREHIANRHQLSVTRGWVNSFIGRHSEELCRVKSVPQEAQRLEVPRCFLDEAIASISQSVQGRPTELVFNLDEVGISDWEDRKTRKVIVPQTMKAQTIHHKINRSLKHVSVIACVSAAGESLTPYIVTSQDSPVVREQLKKRGVRCGTDVILKCHSKPYINSEIFEQYLRTVFLPNLNELRALEQFGDEEAVLMMDNCPSHVTDVILTLLRDAKVRVITWPPHTTQIFQQLDISLFGVLKQRGQYKLPFDDDQSTADFLFRRYRTFKQTMVEVNIWGAFHEAGFEFDVRHEPYRIQFDEEKLRRTRAFQEMWSLDFPLESLSTRGRSAKFGWINQAE
jgi:hypothetical protein